MTSSESKMSSTDRMVVLEVIDSKLPLSSAGLIDRRLFTGDNNLHAIKDPQTCFWYLKYDFGGLPPPLKDQKFTSFTALKKHASRYFETRNVRIKEILD